MLLGGIFCTVQIERLFLTTVVLFQIEERHGNFDLKSQRQERIGNQHVLIVQLKDNSPPKKDF